MRRKILRHDQRPIPQYIPREVALGLSVARAAVRAAIGAARHRLRDALPWLLAAGAAEAGAGNGPGKLLSSGAEDGGAGKNHCEAARRAIERDEDGWKWGKSSMGWWKLEEGWVGEARRGRAK